MTEAQMELIAARAADIAVAKFRTMLQSELNAVIRGVAARSRYPTTCQNQSAQIHPGINARCVHVMSFAKCCA